MATAPTDSQQSDTQEIPEIEAAIAADEAKWAETEQSAGAKGGDRGDGRDEGGRFTRAEQSETGEEAGDDGQRPAGENEEGQPEEGGSQPAKPGQPKQDGTKKEGEKKPPTEQQQSSQNQQKPNGQQQQQQEQQRRSAFAANQQRLEKTWSAINERKTELDAREEALKVREEQFAAQQTTVRESARDENGRTAGDYRKWAQGTRAKAMSAMQAAEAAEARQDWENADAFRTEASRLEALAKKADTAASSIKSRDINEPWAKLAEDLPEAMQMGHEVNRQLLAALKDRSLMADPYGPFRAAIRIGRTVLKATETKLTKAEGEAAKVPKMQKQIEELTAQLNELRTRTALPGGGEANLNRDGAGGPAWEDLPLEEMERRLTAEAAARD
jgi:hypothetical protein